MLISRKEKLTSMGKQSSLIIQDWSFENICITIEDVVNSKNNI
jgi:hypothetical protein